MAAALDWHEPCVFFGRCRARRRLQSVRPIWAVGSSCERDDHAALRRGVLCHSAYRCSVRLRRDRRRRRGNREGAVLHLSGAFYRIADPGAVPTRQLVARAAAKGQAAAGYERTRGLFVRPRTGISMLTWAIV